MSETTEHPILFSGEMVRAILEGRKTMTRRVVKPQPAYGCHYTINGAGNAALHLSDAGGDFQYVPPTARSKDHRLLCPFGSTGDRLWVREALRGDGQPGNRRVGIMRYAADGEMVLDGSVDVIWTYKRPTCPSIHMPRWASRITLEITGVRVERLQNMSVSDAFMEGIKQRPYDDGGDFFHSPTEDFKVLWDNLNAKRGYGWDANPWVWVIEFRRVTQ